MPHSADCPEGRSQLFTFARRGFLQKAASVALLPFVPRSQPVAAPSPQPVTAPNSRLDTVTPPNERPSPEFNIGDLVAQDWEGNEDEDAPQSSTDFGEVVGLCYLPEDSYYPHNTWVYYVHWSHSTCSGCAYPCFDGEPIAGNTLRLVSRG